MPVDEQALADSIGVLSVALHAVDGPPVLSLVGHLGRVVAAARDLLGVDSAGVLLLDDAGMLRAVASSGTAAEALELAQQQLGVGPGADTVARNASVLVPDLAAVPAYALLLAELESSTIRAVLSAPIRIEAEVVGNLNLFRLDVHHWSAAETRAAEAYAELVGRLLQLGARAQSTDQVFSAIHADATDGECNADQC